MKKEYRTILLIQVVYVIIALFVALTLWLILPEASQAYLSINQWKFGGAFAGFVFIWSVLRRAGLLKEALQAASLPVRADIELTPTSEEKYNKLFDGFTNCDFLAFNPPFKLEESGDRLYDEALKTHAKRYTEAGVKSRYLFFDRASYERAQRFFQALGKRIGEDRLKDRVTIRLWENPPTVPGYTFFTGEKEGNPSCIFYPSPVWSEGLPDAVIYIEGAPNFLSILKTHFDENWNKAKQNSPSRVS